MNSMKYRRWYKNCYPIIGLLLWISSKVLSQGLTIDYQEYDLDNGMHVILHQDNETPIVVVSLLYHVGSKDEIEGRSGFAHFFEHLLFEGSKNIERGQYDKLVASAGGSLNANTSFDRTFYFEILPSNQLELGLYLESERLMHAKIDEIGVETQREVVKEEKRQRYDNQPYGNVTTEILKRAYTIHPYKHSPIGSLEDINNATIPEFMEFYNTYYVPNNATLSIAGDIDIEKTKLWINKYFSTIPSSKTVPRISIVEPKQTKEIRDTVYDNIQLPAVIQAYHIPEQGSKDFYTITLLRNLIAGGSSSRLLKSLVDDQEKALDAGAIPMATENPSLLIIYAIANLNVDIKDLDSSLDKEIDIIKTNTITEKELEKVKNQLEAGFIKQLGNVRSIAESLANYHAYFGDANLINTEIERYNKVSIEDIYEVARKYLREENRVVLHWLPQESH